MAGRAVLFGSGAPVTVAECFPFDGISGRLAQAFNVEQTTSNGFALPSISRYNRRSIKFYNNGISLYLDPNTSASANGEGGRAKNCS